MRRAWFVVGALVACQSRDPSSATKAAPAVKPAAPAVLEAPVPPPPVRLGAVELPLGPAEHKTYRILLAFTQIDAPLHGMRLTWPSRADGRVTWPQWIPADQAPVQLAAFAELAGLQPALPELDAAVRAYANAVTADLPQLVAAVRIWNPAEVGPEVVGGSLAPEMQPLFDRFSAASLRVHAALDELGMPEAPPASPYAVARVCFASVLRETARLTGPVVPAEAPTGFAANADRLRTAARRCIDAALVQLDQPVHDLYELGLAFDLGFEGVKEAEARSSARRGYSPAVHTGQIANYLAKRYEKALNSPR